MGGPLGGQFPVRVAACGGCVARLASGGKEYLPSDKTLSVADLCPVRDCRPP